jgi:hypothetical protein
MPEEAQLLYKNGLSVRLSCGVVAKLKTILRVQVKRGKVRFLNAPYVMVC